MANAYVFCWFFQHYNDYISIDFACFLFRMAPLLLIFLLMFGGFYINPDSIPVYFKWAEYVSFVRYG